MRETRYRWVLVITVLILLGMVVASVLYAPEPPPSVEAVPAAQEEVYNSISVKGTVRARRESSEFVSAPARVETCYVALGDTVKAGQKLFQVSYPQVDEQAEQAVETFLQDAVGVSAQQTTGQTVVCASMDGVVAQLPSVGDTLLPGIPAARIGDFSRLTVEAKVPELYASDLEVGQRANVTSVAGGDTIAATLNEIAPYAVQTFSLTGGTQSAVVRCSLELGELDSGLMPGTTVDVKLFTDSVPDAVTVPYAAIRQDGEQQYVFVCQPDGTIKRQDIETGYQLSQGVQVSEGLAAGDWVVCDAGEVELTDGQRVRAYAAK